MASFTGTYQHEETQGFPPVLSADLGQHSPSFGAGVYGTDSRSGALSGSRIVSLISGSISGELEAMHGGELFEKIIVLPREKKVGFVLSTYVFSVEAWNTHTRENKTLASLSVTGSGGLVVSGGLPSGSVFGPFRSSVYVATLGTDGDATIANVANFVFAGGSGTEMVVTGSRLSVFSVEIDWSDGFEETIAYKTNIIPSFSKKEQRIQLRTIPRYSASFLVSTLNAKDTAALDALVSSWQARVFGVPWWMDASPLTASASIGANSIQVDTTNRAAFVAGGLVMIWRDQHTWEALQVQAVTSSSVSFVSPTTKAWSAGDQVVPLKRGRLSDAFNIPRETSIIATVRASFDCEAV